MKMSPIVCSVSLEGIPSGTENPFSSEAMYALLSGAAKELSLDNLARSLPFAASAHEGQFRSCRSKNRIPYIHHPLALACHAISLGITDDRVLSVCMLHDTVEDCGVLPEDLPVSEEIRRAVKLLTRPEGDHREMNGVYYGGILEDDVASLVKCLDRCHNLSNMAAGFSKRKMLRYAGETVQYVYPLLAALRIRCPSLHPALFALEYQIRALVETVLAMGKE